MEFSKNTVINYMGVKDFYAFIDSLYKLEIVEYEGFKIDKHKDAPLAFNLELASTLIIVTDMVINIISKDNAYALRDMINTLQIMPFAYSLTNVSIGIDELYIGIYPSAFNKITIIYSLPKLGIPIIYMQIGDLNLWRNPRNAARLNDYFSAFIELPFMIGVIILDSNIDSTDKLHTNISGIIFNKYANIEFIYINHRYYSRNANEGCFCDIEKIFNRSRKYLIEHPKNHMKSSLKRYT